MPARKRKDKRQAFGMIPIHYVFLVAFLLSSAAAFAGGGERAEEVPPTWEG
jgi:hypothetical protein